MGSADGSFAGMGGPTDRASIGKKSGREEGRTGSPPDRSFGGRTDRKCDRARARLRVRREGGRTAGERAGRMARRDGSRIGQISKVDGREVSA